MQSIEKQTGEKVKKLNILERNDVKIIQSDNGSEYNSNGFAEFCAAKGNLHKYTNPYSPEQNGVAE